MDVLPLAEPIIISDGTECSQVPIAKGQVIFASLYIYKSVRVLYFYSIKSNILTGNIVFRLSGVTMPESGILVDSLKIAEKSRISWRLCESVRSCFCCYTTLLILSIDRMTFSENGRSLLESIVVTSPLQVAGIRGCIG